MRCQAWCTGASDTPGVLREHRRAEPLSSYRDSWEGTCVAAVGPGTSANGMTEMLFGHEFCGGSRAQIAVLCSRFLGQPALESLQFVPQAGVADSQDLHGQNSGVAPAPNRYGRNRDAARHLDDRQERV